MANLVEQIITQGKSIITTTLGSEWQAMRFVFSPEKNDYRTAFKSFGFIPSSASPAATVVKVYTLDHTFIVLLAHTITRTNDDVDRETVLHTLYDKSDEIFKALVNNKINLPSIVLNIDEPSIDAPEFLDDNKVVLLRMNVTVKYRSAL